MHKYSIAYFNWYDKVIQFTEVESLNALEALRDLCHPKFSKFNTEEEICLAEIKRGGFLGFEPLN